MKNLTNKKKVVIILIYCFGITLLSNSCKSDNDDSLTCGCNSETNYTITESENLIGEMFYKTQSDNPLDTYYNNFFWIVYSEENCSNCIHHMIVCNESYLNNEFDYLKNSGEVVEVKISGELKSVCDNRNNPADYTFNRIIITSLEIQ